jgi:hypothetical protein
MSDIDAAITYEPHWEKYFLKHKKIENCHTLFLNHFEFLNAKNDIFNIKYVNDVIHSRYNETDDPKIEDKTIIYSDWKSHDKSNPKNRGKEEILIKQIIVNALLRDVQDSSHDETRFQKYFISRYNHSAMGEKDHYLFFWAVREIKEDIRLYERTLTSGGKFIIEEPKLYILVYVSIIYKHFQLDRLDDKEIESILYKEWMNHVIMKVNDFPWDILKMLKEKEELIYCYSTNDRLFIFRDNMEHLILKIDNIDYKNLIANPATIWSPTGKIIMSSRKYNFLDYFTKNIEEFTDEFSFGSPTITGNIKRHSGINQIFEIMKGITFKEIWKSHREIIQILEENNIINNNWYYHQPPQKDLPKFSQLE